MKKICIIIPFYGRWPPYLDIYIKSCELNNFIDFILFTDLPTPSFCPKNVKFYRITSNQIISLICSKLRIEIDYLHPYKLCDFKPMYGFIFEDYIKDYDFWGHGDIDLIYGDIKNFLSPKLLRENDIISVRKDWISGCFCLYRNIEIVNKLFFESKSFNKVITTQEYQGFDECSKLWSKIRDNDILEIDELQSITFLVKKAVKEGRINATFENLIKESIEPGTYIIWRKGKVLHNKSLKEYLLYHYITEKRDPSFTYPNWEVVPDKFYISKTGFYTENEFNSFKFHVIKGIRKFLGLLKFLRMIPSRIIKKIFLI